MEHLELFLLFLASNLGFTALFLSLMLYFRFKEKILINYFFFIVSLTLFFIPMLLQSYFSIMDIQQMPEWTRVIGAGGGILFFIAFPYFIFEILGKSIPKISKWGVWLIFVVMLIFAVFYLFDQQNRIWSWILVIMQMLYALGGSIYVLFNLKSINSLIARKGLKIFMNISMVYIVWQIIDYALGDRISSSQDLWALPVYYAVICLLSILFMVNVYFQNRLLEKGVLNDSFINNFSITKREKEVISLLVQGKSNKEISEVLFVSFKTVENHIYNVYQKCEVKNRLELFNLAQRFTD